MTAERTSRFRQALPAFGLSVERGTGAVPDDGRCHVVVNGEIRFSSPSQSKAVGFYRQEHARLLMVHGRPEQPMISPEERARMIQQQRVDFDMRAMNQELARTVVANARRKGGKGR